MCSVLSINASVFSLIQGRPSMRSGVTAVLSAAGIVAMGWIVSALVSASQLTTSGGIGRLLCRAPLRISSGTSGRTVLFPL